MTLEQDKGEKPSKMTEENQGEFCFNGDKNDEWLKAVQDLNYLHDMIYPTVLEKDTKGGRRLSSQGRKDLNRIADQIAAKWQRQPKRLKKRRLPKSKSFRYS